MAGKGKIDTKKWHFRV